MNWNLKTNIRLLIGVTSAISVATGAAVSYVVTNKLLEKKFDERLESEIVKAKALYQEMYSQPVLIRDDPPEDELLEAVRTVTQEFDGFPEDLVGRALDAARVYMAEDEENKQTVDDPRPDPNTVINIFQNNTPPGDEVLGALMADRTPEEPYIITKSEFLQNDPDFEQARFTFYEGDQILVDDRDEYNPIMDTERVAGDDNLLRFGYGSGDEYVLYIRNETLDPPLDLHITRVNGKYGEEVMGLDEDEPHLRHSQPRKFRLRDE